MVPYLWLDGQAGLTQSLTSEDTIVCLEGVDQALPVTAQSMIRSSIGQCNIFCWI